jgi:hypothetical protein
MTFYETNPQALRQYQTQEQEQIEQKKYAARMAQQQERFHPTGAIAGASISKPLDLAGELQAYENLLSGLLEQIEALEHRLSPVLLDNVNYATERDMGPDPMGSPVTTRIYHLNSSLRVAAERVARITHAVNI